MVKARTICPLGEPCLDPGHCTYCHRYCKANGPREGAADDIDRLRADLAAAERERDDLRIEKDGQIEMIAMERDAARQAAIKAGAIDKQREEFYWKAQRAEADLAEAERERDEAKSMTAATLYSKGSGGSHNAICAPSWLELPTRAEADLAAAREAAHTVLFHFWNCQGECGKLPGSMAALARLTGYTDQAVEDDIARAFLELTAEPLSKPTGADPPASESKP